MARFLFAALLMALGHCAAAQPAPDSTTTLFRHAVFGSDWAVTLDQPIGVPEGWLEDGTVARVEPREYQLGFYIPFDYAIVFVAVTIWTGEGERVESMRFDYGPGYNYGREVNSYTESLGAPAETLAHNERVVTVWRDSQTHFKLVQEVRDGRKRSHSVLSSLAAPDS